MKVVRPTAITPAVLTSSSLAENDHPAWSAAVTYALGNRVIRTHQIWEAAGPVAAGIDPDTDRTGKWLKIGAANRWRMFDEAAGSASSAAGMIDVTLMPGRVDTLAVLDIFAEKVTVTVVAGGVTVYERVQQTAAGGRAIDNWFDWFFAPIGVRKRLLFEDLPSYRDAVVHVRIEGATAEAPVSVGTMLVGRMFDIGTTLADAGIGIDDYSRKVRDDFGVLTFVQRSYSDRNSYQVMILSARVDAIKEEVAALRATPTLWIGEDGADALLTYGIARTFSITLTQLNGTSSARLEVEGLV